GPAGTVFQAALNKTTVGKMVVPFMRVASNIFKLAQEATPASIMDKQMYDNLAGKNGDIARDTQWARLTVGSAIGAMVANWIVSDRITGSGPVDPTDRAVWLKSHKPYSIRIGSEWYSYQRIGPAGPYLGMIADVTDAKVNGTDSADAVERIVKGISNDVVNEVGMEGLSNIVQAMRDPDRAGNQWVKDMGATMIPFSSGFGQDAAMMDPYQRETNTLIDSLKYKSPWRQSLYPARDWLGTPIANDRQGFGVVIAHRAVNTDPIEEETTELNIKPSKVERSIKGIPLDPGQYDHFQDIAGAMTKQLLEAAILAPGWHN